MLDMRGILINIVNCVMYNTSEEILIIYFLLEKKKSSIWQMCDILIRVQSIHHNEAK